MLVLWLATLKADSIIVTATTVIDKSNAVFMANNTAFGSNDICTDHSSMNVANLQ